MRAYEQLGGIIIVVQPFAISKRRVRCCQACIIREIFGYNRLILAPFEYRV